MSDPHAPPRLRTLTRTLPRELALALARTDDEEPSLEELARLALDVRSRLAFTPSTDHEHRKTPQRFRRALVFHGALGLVLTFGLGAAAGALAATSLFFSLRLSQPHPAKPAASTFTPAVPPRTPRRPQHPPDPPATVSAPVISAPPASSSTAPAVAPVPTTRLSNTAASVGSGTAALAGGAPTLASGAEYGLVSRAQASLATDPGKSLALVSDHERQFPNGTLVEECELIAIDALVRLHRRPEAEARAARFNQRFPASLHRRRLEVLLGGPAASPSEGR